MDARTYLQSVCVLLLDLWAIWLLISQRKG